MNYFFQPDISDGVYILDEEESRHCTRVLRHKSGDVIRILDGKGNLYTCELTHTDRKAAGFKILNTISEDNRTYHLHLAIAPTKNMDRMEWLVEKSIEIGIDQITFLNCEHSERRTINLDRVRKKAVTALKQSGNLFLPAINKLISFDQFVGQVHNTPHLYLCNAGKGNNNTLRSKIVLKQKYVVLVGPEGDFSDSELEKAMDSGYSFISLGKNRLRTETAGIVVCCQLQMIHM